MIKTHRDNVTFICDVCGCVIVAGRGTVHWSELVGRLTTCAAPPCADVRPERTVLGESWHSTTLADWANLLCRATHP
jgi:hypothetical protein